MTEQIDRLEELIDWCIQAVEKSKIKLKIKIASSRMRAGFHVIIAL